MAQDNWNQEVTLAQSMVLYVELDSQVFLAHVLSFTLMGKRSGYQLTKYPDLLSSSTNA